MGDGRDQEPAANEARRSARSVAPPGLPPSPAPTHVPDGSRRVPNEFRPSRTCPRQESEFRGAEPARPGTGRNSRGTEWGLGRNRDPSGSSRTGTEWGLGPFTMEQTTEDVTVIHRLAASRPPRATAVSPPAAGSDSGRRSAGRSARRSHTPAGRAIRTAPNPGTSRRRRARSEREPGRALERRARWDGSAEGSAVIREGSPVPDGRRRAGRRPSTPCGRQGGR